MKRTTKGIWLIVTGIILAAGVGFFAHETVTNAMQKTTVVVAAHDIQPFTQITAKDVKLTHRPASGIPDHSATSLNQVVGTYTKGLILKGSPVRKGYIALHAKDLSAVLTQFNDPGIRAFSLPTNNPMIKRINPGNRVDLYAKVKQGKKETSYLIAQNVQVMGIAKSNDKPVGLILALTPKQIQTVIPVMDNVEISLVPDNAPKTTGPSTSGQKTNQSIQ